MDWSCIWCGWRWDVRNIEEGAVIEAHHRPFCPQQQPGEVAECPHCGLMVAAKADGTLKAHGRRAQEAGRLGAACASHMATRPPRPKRQTAGFGAPGFIDMPDTPLHNMGRAPTRVAFSDRDGDDRAGGGDGPA